MTDYNLSKSRSEENLGKTSKVSSESLKKLLKVISSQRRTLFFAFLAIIVNSLVNLISPAIIAYVIDNHIVTKEYAAVLRFAFILFMMYLFGLVAAYLQTQLMGDVGQRVLFKLRNMVFGKIQELPVAFFNQNKAGDLISRINNDTDKLNQFFSQSLVQFAGNLFVMIGSVIFLLSLNFKLGVVALLPAVSLFFFTRILSPWVKSTNKISMGALGDLSSQIQESLGNFKVIIAFNRRDYFRKKFEEANAQNYHSAVKAGVANNIFRPVYELSANVAQILVLAYGIYLISVDDLTVGLLIGFFAYVNAFYQPLRHLAHLWANLQVALAGWDRIADILALESDLAVKTNPEGPVRKSDGALLEFRNVRFAYPDGKEVLHNINFILESGKTYALVGPTGGGKTTTASLMARLYDPSAGDVLFDGRDIESYSHKERTDRIGFILQDPFLFNGTLKENILYGNDQYHGIEDNKLEKLIKELSLFELLARFKGGLQAEVLKSGDTISLGQKQLIAFIRAVLRSPDLLILDEATANLDTVTEQLLENVLEKLPDTTTKVVIAHRLNTIENADQIFFVNAGKIELAGSFDHALEMLLHGHRSS